MSAESVIEKAEIKDNKKRPDYIEEKINDTVLQYTTHGSFAGYVREVTIL